MDIIALSVRRIQNWVKNGGTSKPTDFQPNAVMWSEIADGFEAGLSSKHLAAGAVDATQIASGAVTATKLGSNAVTGTKLSVSALAFLVFNGVNGAGACTLTGAKVGDKVVGVTNLTDGSSGTSSFEATISVANQIQQSDAANLSTKKFNILLVVKG